MLLRSALRVLVTALGATCVGVVGAMTGISRVNVTLAVVIRTVLVLAFVLTITRAFRIGDRRAVYHGGRPYQQVLIVAGLAYFVNISSWGGHTLFGQLLVPAGVLSALIDLVTWMAIAMVGVLMGERARVRADPAPIPYS